MDAKADIKFYRECWKAVEEIERSGLGKYNPITRLLISLGVRLDNNVEQMQIILRWAKLKEFYEQDKLNVRQQQNSEAKSSSHSLPK
jgi:hypothetical protein